MPYINSTKFGEIVVDNKKYHQVLIVNGEVRERETKKLDEIFGTSHQIGDWEIKALFENNPEMIIVGTGQSGVLKVSEDLIKKAKEAGVELVIELTLQAIEIYNEKVEGDTKVNALIHTTC